MTSTDVVQDHEKRISNLEQTVGSMSMELAALRAENSAQSAAFLRGLDQMRGSLNDLTIQISEQNGAQKVRNELDEAKTRKWQRRSYIIGGILGFFATMFSFQEIPSYIWVKILHLPEPW